MTLNTVPVFPRVPNIGVGTVSAANTNRDGTGTIVTVFTAGTDGSRVKRMTVQGTGTTTAGFVRIFLHDGSNFFLWKEIAVTAITPSASVAAFVYVLELFDEEAIDLPNSNYSLRFSTHNAETFKITVEGANF